MPTLHWKSVTTLAAPLAAVFLAPIATAQPANASYTNWTGYQARLAAPTSAQATWRVPSVSWQGRDGYSNQWVGVGGGSASQGELIQAGTESDSVCVAASRGRCTKSRASYYLWLETFPTRYQERVTNLPLNAGDTVQVKASYNAARKQAEFSLCNLSRNACVSAARACPPPRSVAEFVVERPTGPTGTPRALAKFGASNFSGAQIKSNAQTFRPRSLPLSHITMFNGHTLASSSALNAGGDGFSTTFYRPL